MQEALPSFRAGSAIPAPGTSPMPSRYFGQSGNVDNDQFQTRDILKILRVGGQQGKVPLDSLGSEPKVLNSKVGAAAGLLKFSSEQSKNLAGLTGDAEKGLAAQPAKRCHRPLLPARVGHQLDAEADFCKVYRRKKHGLLLGDCVNVCSAELASLDRNPQVAINQEAHGFRRECKPAALRLRARLTAWQRASAVLSSSVR